MARVAREVGLDIFHVHYAVPHATAAYLAVQMLNSHGARAPKIVTTLHGTDTTLLGQDPSYRDVIEHSLSESDAITTVSENLREETLATFRLNHTVEVIPNFFIPSEPKRSRAELRRELEIGEDEFLVVHTSNVRPLKTHRSFVARFCGQARSRRAMKLLILAGGSFAPYDQLLDELALRDGVIVRENVIEVEDYPQRRRRRSLHFGDGKFRA